MVHSLLPFILALLIIPDIIIYKIFVKRRTQNMALRSLWWLPCLVLVLMTLVISCGIKWNEHGLELEAQIFGELFIVLWLLDSCPKACFCILYGLQQWYANYKPSVTQKRLWHPYMYAFIPSAVGFLMILTGFAFGFRHIVVREEEYCSSDVPEAFDGYRIVQFTDVHLGTFRVFDEDVPLKLKNIINEQHADLVVFTGDMVNDKAVEMNKFENDLKGIAARDGVYTIMGNHDYSTYVYWSSARAKKDNIRDLQKRQEQLGWRWLLNEHVMLHRGGDSIALIGVENDGNPHFPALADMPKAMKGIPSKSFKILLSHDPTHWRRAILGKTDIQLQLSGHTHGMQLELFGMSPAKLIYPEWGGWYREKGQSLYVSTGVGGVVYPFRFGVWPEVVVFTLHHKK